MNALACNMVNVRAERWPIAGDFTISRGSKTQAEVVVVELAAGADRGWGECVPYGRYGETVAGVMAAIESMRDKLAQGLDRAELQRALPPGAARNALDCALWDLAAKRSGRPVHELAGRPAPQPVRTAYTISLGTPEELVSSLKGTRRIVATLQNPVEYGSLEEMPGVQRVVPEGLDLVVHCEERPGIVADVVAGFVRAGGDIADLAVRRPSLADVYVKLTGEALNDDEA